jgi:gluconokinase
VIDWPASYSKVFGAGAYCKRLSSSEWVFQDMSLSAHFIIIMGVSGSGKTTIGQMLADRLGWDFYDADQYHPIENITKMANGIPLADSDREPWLDRLSELIAACLQENRPGVLACSALKEKYRERLTGNDAGVRVIYLKGDFDLIYSRVNARENHYMKPELLRSQFEALEEPSGALMVEVWKEPGEICDEILAKLHTRNSHRVDYSIGGSDQNPDRSKDIS